MPPNLLPRSPLPSAFADDVPRTVVRLMFGKVPVMVSYTYGTMLPRFQGGVDIIAQPQGCTDCMWAQVYQRTGSVVAGWTKDGDESGPMYNRYPMHLQNYFEDRPAINAGNHGTLPASPCSGSLAGSSKPLPRSAR